MGFPRVSIIVLNWNGFEDTSECLESLQRITYPNYEVIVVDNASVGNDVESLAGKFGSYIHIIRNDRNYGFAKGNNAGIRHALENGADYVFVLNNDTVVDPKFLDELIAVAKSDSMIGMLSPLVYLYYQPETIYIGLPYRIHLWRGELTIKYKPDYNQPSFDSDFLAGGAVLIPRKTIDSIGPWPEEYFLGMEDVDYSLRATRAGFRLVLVTKAKIWNKGAQPGKRLNTARVVNQYRGWTTLRRKYLTRVFPLAMVCGLVWQVIVTLRLLFSHTIHGDFRWIRVLPAKVVAALKATFSG